MLLSLQVLIALQTLQDSCHSVGIFYPATYATCLQLPNQQFYAFTIHWYASTLDILVAVEHCPLTLMQDS